MFDAKSRYANAPTEAVPDSRGRTVVVVLPPDAPKPSLLGLHVLRQGERLDHLAAKYLDNPTGTWRLAEQNDVMLPESLTEAPEIQIPAKSQPR